MTQEIDYHITFKVSPGNMALISTEYVILDVNEGWLESTGRERDEIVGHNILEALPANPHAPEQGGPAALRSTIEAAVRSCEPEVVPLARYDIEDPARPGEFEQRFWSAITTPVFGPNGRVTMIVLWTQEVTHVVSQMRAHEVQHG